MAEVLDRPVTPRRAQTQERLMAAAGRVFAERGISGASVEEISEAAGFTRGAFYSNFADKDELVLAMIRQSIDTQVAAAERAVARSKATPGALDAADLVTYTLAAFDESRLGGRDNVLAERELLLYAARQPALREPYLAFVAECDRQLTVLILDALAYADLEFRVPATEGVALLIATWQHQQTELLFDAAAQPMLMHTLLLAITRTRSPRP